MKAYVLKFLLLVNIYEGLRRSGVGKAEQFPSDFCGDPMLSPFRERLLTGFHPCQRPVLSRPGGAQAFPVDSAAVMAAWLSLFILVMVLNARFLCLVPEMLWERYLEDTSSNKLILFVMEILNCMSEYISIKISDNTEYISVASS